MLAKTIALKTGEILTLKIEELSPQGWGVGFFEGQPILVKEGLPGDQVQAKLTRVRPGRLEAKLLKVERASSQRVIPRCPHFGPCGGCDLQHMGYPSQVEWKARVLAEILRREAGLHSIPPIRTIPMEEPWAYRSKMEFSFGQEGQRITLGFHQRGSFHRIVDIRECHIAAPAVSALVGAIKEVANAFDLKAYNPKIHQGFWRYAVIRSSLNSGELMLLIVTNEGPREPIEALASILPKRVSSLKSLYWGISTRVSDVAHPERIELLFGSEFLEDRVGPIRFKVKPTNFVQPNLALAARIYEVIQENALLTGREAVYDLYSGIGLIALCLASKAKVVVGVESGPENVAVAEENARLNGISNTTFLCGKVEDLLKGTALFKAGLKPDLVVVDPPRAGLHKETYGPLLESRVPALVYLSCNPVSLARDIGVVLKRDPHYRLEAVDLFDFFPHTTHLELLVTLRRRPASFAAGDVPWMV